MMKDIISCKELDNLITAQQDMPNMLLQVFKGLEKIINDFHNGRLLKKGKSSVSDLHEASNISASSDAKDGINLWGMRKCKV